ncbi:hypothetical protein [Desulfotalea psychrophila]|uniref:hypothetical protein n=1 Tax=Desulfotalea psychrophila TaxID=84980 RepID=UPI00059E4D0D|nr:hypothetical protein [Desulfotalea psychrophila]
MKNNLVVEAVRLSGDFIKGYLLAEVALQMVESNEGDSFSHSQGLFIGSMLCGLGRALTILQIEALDMDV